MLILSDEKKARQGKARRGEARQGEFLLSFKSRINIKKEK